MRKPFYSALFAALLLSGCVRYHVVRVIMDPDSLRQVSVSVRDDMRSPGRGEEGANFGPALPGILGQ